jgi:hypothetical protein
MARTGKRSHPFIPSEAAQSCGYRFPQDRATPTQMHALRRLMRDYIRTIAVKRFSNISVDLLGDVFGLEDRQAKTVVARARNLEIRAEADFVLQVLRGMHTGEIAGVLGTTKNMNTRYFFRLVYEFNIKEHYRELCEYFCVWLVPLPADAHRDGPSGMTVLLTDERGNERVANVYNDSDGSRWIEDPSNPKDLEALMMWHAAFCIDYRDWLEAY